MPPQQHGQDGPDGPSAPGGPAPVNPLYRRAAIVQWIVGGLATVFFSCSAAGVLTIPMQLNNPQFAGQLSPDQLKMLQMLAPHVKSLAIGIALLGALPGIAHLLLAFFVKNGSRAASLATVVLSSIQGTVLALLALLNVIEAVAIGQPAMATSSVLLLGTLAAPLFYLAFLLSRANRQRPGEADAFDAAADYDLTHDPWR